MPGLTPRAALTSEPVDPWRAWARKARTLATVTWRRPSVPDPDDLPQKALDLSQRAAGELSLPRRVLALWRIEGLTLAIADHHFDSLSLRTCSLPIEAGPPAQCGLSMAAVLNTGFKPERLSRLLEEKANPLFIDFAFETLGLMLAAYEPSFFGRTAALLGNLKLMRRHSIEPSDPADFLRHLAEPERLLAAHGYGRLLYFRSHRLRDAVQAIRARSFLPFSAAVRGAMAAYLLINSADADRILGLANTSGETDLERAVAGGLHNNLKLLEWSLPGCLENLQAPTQHGDRLLAEAVAEARQRRKLGEGPGLVA